jgi:alpha-D-ribose 1-methylphosphonate 5-triphosphate synthase subunit PhnG
MFGEVTIKCVVDDDIYPSQAKSCNTATLEETIISLHKKSKQREEKKKKKLGSTRVDLV